MENFNECCFICDCALSTGPTDEVKQKGIKSLVSCSEKRQDGKYVLLTGLQTIKVHKKCRKLYCNEKCIKAVQNRRIRPTTSGVPSTPENEPFDFQCKCLFCTEEITAKFLENERKKSPGKRINVHKIRASNRKQGIIKAAKRINDDWSKQVLSRIEGIDLFKAGAQYHRPCYSKFCLPARPSGKKIGRPQDCNVSSAMESIYDYLEENRGEHKFSLPELRNVVKDCCPSNATIKTKLIEKYGNNIVITSSVGRPTIICFRNTGHQLLVDSSGCSPHEAHHI